MKIQDYINNRNKYKVDVTYQRPNNAWSNEDRQCLIDTILREEPLPIFFMNAISSENVFYIVDGQQRLKCISDFYDNKIKLNGKFSDKELAGKTFNGENALDDKNKTIFLNYDLKIHLMEDYDDERVRLIFSRLQRGKPLFLGERLNAKPGTIVDIMRELAKHDFIAKSIDVSKDRYGTFPDVARILFYETYGAKNCGSEDLYNFFDTYKELDKNTQQYKNTLSILNYLLKCFPATPGNYGFIEKHAWVLAIYSMVRELKLSYSLIELEQKIHEFIKDFHSKVYNEDFRKSNSDYQRFYDNIRGGWSEKIISIRRDILISNFLKKYQIYKLDDKRQIADEKKIEIFSEHKDCEICSKPFKDYKEAEYHHIIRYADGGKTEVENIMIVCSKCHDMIHGNTKIEYIKKDV